MKWLCLFSFSCLSICIPVCGQDSTTTSRNWSIAGYVKALQNIQFDPLNHSNNSNQLIHNRLRFKWKPKENLQFSMELRNRIFTGNSLHIIPNYASRLRNTSENLNLQVAWINEPDVIFHTNVERFYVDWKEKKWTFRLGRQRINWGINTLWNPNDLFNTYNFLDVDYEERPGSDAIKTQYTISDFSHVEMVYSRSLDRKDIFAMKYFLNHWSYDFQFIAGSYRGLGTWGLGWAGNIKDAGFKGEAQYFSDGQINISSGLDYMFPKGWYLNTGFLFNSEGLNEKVLIWPQINLNFSAKNLMPAKYNFLFMFSKEINPLLSISLSTVYSPRLNLIIAIPSIRYSLSSQIELDMIVQNFFLDNIHISDMGMLRARWSF
ncbi:hypothetical protein [Aquirufa aurantiipilula]|uniref:hypothetical protein n=1 Tax=Aquirufa aurantiipilula TaxID=2696561 RepID=UPI001CAA43BB|nr:hypothetical protein [Aquirufa aurantiipilula]MBZ1325630.1 hypothetical protein [Aquirufa aurantiipilula]